MKFFMQQQATDYDLNLERKKLVSKWRYLDDKIFKSLQRKRDGFVCRDTKTRTLVYRNFGIITFKRRRYCRTTQVGTTWHYLLDEFLGLGKGEKVDHNLKDKIVALIKLGLSNVAISGHLGVSTQTVSRTLNDKKRWQQKEEPKIKVTDHFYLTIDETTISLRFGRSAKRWRIWVLVIYTGVTLDKKGRNQCTNRRTYLEVYPQGFQVDANLYQKRVEEFIKRNYIYNKGTVILGSTDGAESLKRVVQNLPNSVLILSKFHYRKNKRHMPNLKFQNYCLNNKEGIENWNHPLSLGYCAEGNISKIKSIFAFGNRIYSVTSFKNILASKGISVKVFEGEKKSK